MKIVRFLFLGVPYDSSCRLCRRVTATVRKLSAKGMRPLKDVKRGINEKLGAGVFDIRGEILSIGPYEQPAYNE